jgi:hypothetical protein
VIDDVLMEATDDMLATIFSWTGPSVK